MCTVQLCVIFPVDSGLTTCRLLRRLGLFANWWLFQKECSVGLHMWLGFFPISIFTRKLVHGPVYFSFSSAREWLADHWRKLMTLTVPVYSSVIVPRHNGNSRSVARARLGIIISN